jgi:hypothetical protein
MWRELILSLDPKAMLLPPATEEQIAALEQTLGVALPGDLKSLLRESNGVAGEYGVSLIWSTEEIAERNIAMRTQPPFLTDYMPFESLLFFADAGNGDQFAYRIIQQTARENRIYAWNHEDDGRTSVAWLLQDFLERWLNGTLKI